MIANNRSKRLLAGLLLAGLPTLLSSSRLTAEQSAPRTFRVEEATIADVHRAIQDGSTTCRAIVQTYIERARAYNGSCTQLVTADGGSIAPRSGAVRAGSPVSFPASTTAIGSLLPNFDEYRGPPIDFGRMEATSSDPTVSQQYGMVVGLRNAGQINALSTLNIRGERSVSCKAQCDTSPAAGPLPASCPKACEDFRKQPDALERAAALDAQYGRNPDLKALPMYCVAFSFKDVYDTADMRSTGGGDVNYAMDAPPRDSTIVAELRAKGAIIYAKANLAEYNAGSGDPGGAAKVAAREYGAGARSTWGGTACNPYDTARETGGSSSGSAASVAANLVQCSICEETGGSCRQPAWRNDVVALVTTKGLMPYGGAIGADPYLDRAGIQCRTVTDAARVLDALKDPVRGYFDPRDIYSALPKGLVAQQPYASFANPPGAGSTAKPLAGVRIGVVREYMVKHSANDAAMSDLVNAEIKNVLRDRLGAELVESFDPMYPDDPSIPNMTYNFQQALAEILPFHMPEHLQRPGRDGALLYAVPNADVTKREYMVKAGEGQAPWPDTLNLRSVNNGPPSASFAFNFAQYLLRRGDARVNDWATLNAHAKYYNAARVAAMKNWEHKVDLASDGMTQNIKMREVMRLVILKVMRQNNIDVLVNPTTTIPPARIGYANQPVVNDRPVGRFPTSANVGIPEITVPAGFNTIVYDPDYALNAAKNAYAGIANETRPTTLEFPLPVGIAFWAGPGDEGIVIKAAAAYEAATRHRVAPPAFPALSQSPKKNGSFQLVEASVDDVHAAYRSGVLTARQLVRAYLDRIEAYDKKGPTINAIITVNPRALEDADALDAAFKKSGAFVGPLHGIPIVVKDEIDTAGMPTTEGTLVFKNYRPTRDAFVVERLRKAGAIILGKTTLSEFAGGDTYGSMFGVTRNPYDLERTVGGSSGGSGAALAANFSTLALGEETSASIRRPGAWNAIVSLRPTPGLVSRSGMWDGYPSPTAQMGPMARTVRDLAQLLDAMVGYDAEDPVTALGIGRAPASYTKSLDANGLKGARIGILRESIGQQSEPGSDDFKKVDLTFEKNVAELRAAGATIIDPIVIPDLKALLAKRASNPDVADAAMRRYLARNPNSPFTSREDIARSPDMAKSIPPSKAKAWDGPRPATDIAKWGEYLQAREQLLINIAKVMADNRLDAIVHKSVEHQPALIKDGMNPPYTSAKGVPTLNTFLVFAASMTVPSGFTSDGLPVGITFFGLPYSEPALIKLAYGYEQATRHRVPPKTTPPLDGPNGSAPGRDSQPAHVPSRPETTVWGEFPIDRTPVVTVKAGDIVRIDTLSHQGATQDEDPVTYLGGMGVKKDEILPDVVDFWKSRSSRPREGRAGHVLTGPIYVEGAEPGDTLEVQILDYALRVPYGINGGTGVLGAAYPGTLKTDVVPEGGRKLIRTGTLDGEPVAFVASGVAVPVRPFMGIMAVAPPAPTLRTPGVSVAGVANSRAPGAFGGNMDFKELTAGTSLLLPVFHHGGQFYVGDPHSAQGDGEVDGTAIEHSLTGTYRFIVHKGHAIPYPRVETATHHILMGIDVDLNRAMRIAVQQVVEFLMVEKKMTSVDALALASVGCDFHVAEAVDLTQVVVGKIPKSVFTSGARE